MPDKDYAMQVLAEAIADLKGRELKFDFTTKNGKVVDAYIAQADIDVGLTVRGAFPWSDDDKADDRDLRCLNKKEYGKKKPGWTMQDYYLDLINMIKAVESGVLVAERTCGFGSQVSCGF